MPLPLILLFILFIRGITLPGAMEGILYYITPNFAALLDPQVWIAAASQIFFTLTLGFGVMIAYASYNKNTQDIAADSYITAIANSAISIFAGFVVFSVLGYMAQQTSVAVASVAASGPGLAFVVFPEALALFSGWAWLFSALFFLTLLSLGVDSAFSLVEAVNTVFTDKYKKSKTKEVAFIVCTVAFIIGILFTTGAGLYLLDIVDHFVINYGLIIVGIFQCIAIGWIYGADKLRQYINKVSKWQVGVWWNYAIKYVIPVVLLVFLVLQFVTDVTTPYEGYPQWALAIGWVVVAVPILFGLYFLLAKPKDIP
jgi:NSS family neurotransmitter:Na+ symporter